MRQMAFNRLSTTNASSTLSTVFLHAIPANLRIERTLYERLFDDGHGVVDSLTELFTAQVQDTPTRLSDE